MDDDLSSFYGISLAAPTAQGSPAAGAGPASPEVEYEYDISSARKVAAAAAATAAFSSQNKSSLTSSAFVPLSASAAAAAAASSSAHLPPVSPTSDFARSGEVAEARAMLDLDSQYFDSEAYVSHLFATLPMQPLLDASTRLSTAKRSLDTDMQTLVYENYNRFISATDVIRTMKQNVDAMDAEMARLQQAVAAIQSGSAKVNAALAPPRERVEHLHHLSSLLHKLNFLIRLPAMIQTHVSAGRFRAAVRAFTLAAPLLRRYSSVPSFSRILSQTEQIVANMVTTLQAVVTADAAAASAAGPGARQSRRQLRQQFEARLDYVWMLAELGQDAVPLLEALLRRQEEPLRNTLTAAVAAANAAAAAPRSAAVVAAAAAAGARAGPAAAAAKGAGGAAHGHASGAEVSLIEEDDDEDDDCPMDDDDDDDDDDNAAPSAAAADPTAAAAAVAASGAASSAAGALGSPSKGPRSVSGAAAGSASSASDPTHRDSAVGAGAGATVRRTGFWRVTHRAFLRRVGRMVDSVEARLLQPLRKAVQRHRREGAAAAAATPIRAAKPANSKAASGAVANKPASAPSATSASVSQVVERMLAMDVNALERTLTVCEALLATTIDTVMEPYVAAAATELKQTAALHRVAAATLARARARATAAAVAAVAAASTPGAAAAAAAAVTAVGGVGGDLSAASQTFAAAAVAVAAVESATSPAGGVLASSAASAAASAAAASAAARAAASQPPPPLGAWARALSRSPLLLPDAAVGEGTRFKSLFSAVTTDFLDALHTHFRAPIVALAAVVPGCAFPSSAAAAAAAAVAAATDAAAVLASWGLVAVCEAAHGAVAASDAYATPRRAAAALVDAAGMPMWKKQLRPRAPPAAAADANAGANGKALVPSAASRSNSFKGSARDGVPRNPFDDSAGDADAEPEPGSNPFDTPLSPDNAVMPGNPFDTPRADGPGGARGFGDSSSSSSSSSVIGSVNDDDDDEEEERGLTGTGALPDAAALAADLRAVIEASLMFFTPLAEAAAALAVPAPHLRWTADVPPAPAPAVAATIAAALPALGPSLLADRLHFLLLALLCGAAPRGLASSALSAAAAVAADVAQLKKNYAQYLETFLAASMSPVAAATAAAAIADPTLLPLGALAAVAAAGQTGNAPAAIAAAVAAAKAEARHALPAPSAAQQVALAAAGARTPLGALSALAAGAHPVFFLLLARAAELLVRREGPRLITMAQASFGRFGADEDAAGFAAFAAGSPTHAQAAVAADVARWFATLVPAAAAPAAPVRGLYIRASESSGAAPAVAAAVAAGVSALAALAVVPPTLALRYVQTYTAHFATAETLRVSGAAAINVTARSRAAADAAAGWPPGAAAETEVRATLTAAGAPAVLPLCAATAVAGPAGPSAAAMATLLLLETAAEEVSAVLGPDRRVATQRARERDVEATRLMHRAAALSAAAARNKHAGAVGVVFGAQPAGGAASASASASAAGAATAAAGNAATGAASVFGAGSEGSEAQQRLLRDLDRDITRMLKRRSTGAGLGLGLAVVGPSAGATSAAAAAAAVVGVSRNDVVAALAAAAVRASGTRLRALALDRWALWQAQVDLACVRRALRSVVPDPTPSAGAGAGSEAAVTEVGAHLFALIDDAGRTAAARFSKHADAAAATALKTVVGTTVKSVVVEPVDAASKAMLSDARVQTILAMSPPMPN